MSFPATTSLTDLEEQLRVAGAPITRATTDGPYGRQLQLSPDGLLIRIDELDPDPFSER